MEMRRLFDRVIVPPIYSERERTELPKYESMFEWGGIFGDKFRLSTNVSLSDVKNEMKRCAIELHETKEKLIAYEAMLRRMEVFLIDISKDNKGGVLGNKTFTFGRDISIEKFRDRSIVYVNGKEIFYGDAETARKIYDSGKIDLIPTLK